MINKFENLFARKYNFKPIPYKHSTIFDVVKDGHGIISYNGGEAFVTTHNNEFSKGEGTLHVWTVEDGRDGRCVGSIPLDDKFEETLSEWLTNIGQGLYRCGECGRWIRPEESQSSGFVGIVCLNCEPSPCDTLGD